VIRKGLAQKRVQLVVPKACSMLILVHRSTSARERFRNAFTIQAYSFARY
jgi:hypothetical protein